MNESIKFIYRDTGRKREVQPKGKFENEFNFAESTKVRNFHKSFPEYTETPLVSLASLAKALGLKSFFLKDESFRFGLNAFKALGGSYAIAKIIVAKLGVDLDEINFDYLTSPEVHEKIKDITVVTATDGNHGRGVAWTANKLGIKSIVYMPHGSAEERLENIRKLGATASITDMNYDDTVRFANEQAEKNGWMLVQDTTFEDYELIPKWIMQGYTTIGNEIAEQLSDEKVKPTHIFLQAGVGAMAGAITAFFADYYKESKPLISIVEPNKADCIFRTAEAGDGKLHIVDGELDSIMAGLCCGVPCEIGWDFLDSYAETFFSVPDSIAAKGMRVLGNPCGSDKRVISGESGAVTTGIVTEIMQNDSLCEIKKQLGVDENSVVLCISTEGDTYKESYRRIVWDGEYPSL